MFSRLFHPKILAVNCGVFGMVQFDQPLAVDFATEALKIVGWKLLQVARKQFQMRTSTRSYRGTPLTGLDPGWKLVVKI